MSVFGEHNKLQIVYATDAGFQYQTYVSMYSVIANKKSDYCLDFIVLIPMGTRDLFDMPYWDAPDYSIRYIEIDDTIFGGMGDRLEGITKPTLYRLMIPLLPEIGDKCIYIDGDTLCCDDIANLYDINIEDYCVAGCRQAFPMAFFENFLQYQKERDFKNGIDYINAGVLLLNVKLIRGLNIDMVEENKENYPDQDQGTINKCFYGKTKILPPKYNYYPWIDNMIKFGIELRYEREILLEAQESYCIIHYANYYSKPWRNDRCAHGEEWWEMARMALQESQVQIIESILKNNMYEYGLLRSKFELGMKAYICGCGKRGRQLWTWINEYGFSDNILGFVDNNDNIVGTVFETKEVISFEVLKKMQENEFVIISTSKYYKEIRDQLLEMGIAESRIIKYRCLGWKYKLSCDDLEKFTVDELWK